MLIQDAIREFIDLRDLDNCSAKTIRTYEQRLRYFSQWLLNEHNVVEVNDLKVEHLRGWMAYLKKTPSYRGKAHSDDTIHSYGQSVVVFCHWLEQEEYVDHLVTKRFKLPRMEEKDKPTFTREDIQKLLRACEQNGASNEDVREALIARDKAIVTLLVDSGIRLNELVSLRLDHVDKHQKMILVHGKGNRWAYVPVTRTGFRPLHIYLSKYREVLARVFDPYDEYKPNREDAVFLAENGEPLTYWGVAALFKRLQKRIGITDKQVSAHTCRSYMATVEIENGRSEFHVQRQLRHKTLKMTNHYTRSLSARQIRKSHEKYSPWVEGVDDDGPKGRGYWE